MNVYYHVDTIQRYIQSLGITTANNRQTECDAPDNSVNAGWYSPIDRGLHFSDSGPCRPDRGEDGHVMLHEYGHAIQDNQVPGWGGVNPVTGRDETRAMGEGFGDTWRACTSLTTAAVTLERFSSSGSSATREVCAVSMAQRSPTNWITGNHHANGEIWSAALWNIYRATGGDSINPADHEAARRALLKTVILKAITRL